ncbi:MAG: hypothetical protein MI863_28390 [Desulfobacterales bacterium]|nr:hypothetical protein [Desulfobacterales bacterium]
MTAMKNEFKPGIFLGFVLAELGKLRIYISAAVIGFIICFFTDNYSIIPFVVPLFVQVIARSNLKYRQRHLSALVELPAQTDAPVFIMDRQGQIILSIGRTLDLFQEYGITHIQDLVNPELLDQVLEMAESETPQYTNISSVEAFSNITLRWYEIKAKAMASGGSTGKILVWFQDITLRKNYDFRLRDLVRYSDSLMISLENLAESGAEFEHLSSFLLKDYEAVFITRADEKKNLSGYVFKSVSEKIQKSDTIMIPNESLAPINISRKKAEIISDDMDAYDSTADFLKQNPLDPRVLEFIDAPVRNFITYNEADLSIIAFNFRSKISSYEKRFFEILVNNYRTMVMLIDLEKELKNTPNGLKAEPLYISESNIPGAE